MAIGASELGTGGERFAQRLLNIDWSLVILRTCALRGWRQATLARKVGSGEQHLRRLARGDLQEPNSFKLAFALLDQYHDAKRDA